MALTARYYQETAIAQIRLCMSRGCRKVLLHMATGGGKTFIFSNVINASYAKNKRVLLAVRGRALVNNASHRLTEQGVPHGVMMAGHWRSTPAERVQVCSIDTLYARRDKTPVPAADLIVIDEAHQAQCASYRWFVDQYPHAFFLGVSATPHLKRGLRHLADTVVYPISISQLIDQGYLVPPRYFAPSRPDLSQCRIDRKTDDYVIKDLVGAMATAKLSGDIVDHYKKYAAGRPALAFAVNIEHSRLLVGQFAQAGITAEHMDLNSSDSDRAAVLDRLRTGATMVVSNVGILGTGVDMPYVSALILARPTKSYNLFIQQIGRGTRPYAGKADFVVLDHAGNIDEHGFIEHERACDLDGEGAKSGAAHVTCKDCYLVWEPHAPPPHVCPSCGYVAASRAGGGPGNRSTIDLDATRELTALDPGAVVPKAVIKNRVEALILQAVARGYKPGWVFHIIKDEHGEAAAKGYWRTIKKRVPGSPA